MPLRKKKMKAGNCRDSCGVFQPEKVAGKMSFRCRTKKKTSVFPVKKGSDFFPSFSSGWCCSKKKKEKPSQRRVPKDGPKKTHRFKREIPNSQKPIESVLVGPSRSLGDILGIIRDALGFSSLDLCYSTTGLNSSWNTTLSGEYMLDHFFLLHRRVANQRKWMLGYFQPFPISKDLVHHPIDSQPFINLGGNKPSSFSEKLRRCWRRRRSYSWTCWGREKDPTCGLYDP